MSPGDFWSEMITVFVDRPIGTSMGALAVALLGVAACLRLPVDLLPSLELPRVSVEVRLEDASAAEVEELITIPVEQALSGAPGVQEIDSVSRDGIAVVSLAFPWRTDVDLAILNVRERLDEVRDLVPEAASPPAVRRWDPGNRPFLVLAASTVGPADRSPPVGGERDGAGGPGRSIPGDTAASSRLIALSRAVRAILRPRLEQIDGVASAELVGDLDQRVLVEIDPVGARLLDVAPGEIAEAIRRAVTVPESGTLRRGPYRYSLRVPALVQSVADFETIVVSAPGVDPRVRLGDVARTTVAPDEPETVLRFDGRPAVGIRVYKEAAANALAVTDLAHRQLDAFRTEQPGIRVDVAHEQAGFIRAAVGGTLMSVLLGGVLAFGVLFCFLGDWRQPVVIGVVVPVAVLGALAAMDWLGVSINLISLGGLALGIGLLVNTAIIVVENVHRHRERGLAPAAAAVAGTAEVVAPITGVTITTLVIFLPVLAAGGFAGALFRDQAIAVVAAVTVAWVAALTLVPALSTRLAGRRPVRAAREPWTPALRRLLTALLRRRRTVLVGAAVLVAAGAVLAVRAPREVAPPVDTGDLSVVAEPRHHMAIEQLALAAARLEDALGSVAGATRVLSTAGVQVDNALTGGGSRRSDVRAQFHADDTAGLDALGATLEHALPGFDVRVGASETPLHDVLGLLAGPVDVAFSGPDLAELRRAVDTFAAEVTGRGDLGRIVDAPLDPERQIRLDLDHRALAELGLSTADVAEQVGYATRGETVAQLRFADPPLPVVLRRPLERGAAAAPTLDRIFVVPPRGPAGGGDGAVPGRAPAVPLRDLGTAASEAAAAEVVRRDHRRTLTLGVDPAGLPRVTLEARLNEALDGLRLPTGIRAQVRTRHAEAADALASLRWVLLVSLVLVVLCLSAEFESVRLALVVLLAVPLTLSGVAVTWWVFGLSINLFTGMAAAVLIGIGVDDAVLMVDFMRRKHRDAPPGGARSAIVEAALQRVRPILMTTVTTVLAVAPLALTSAPAQELQRALALTLIGGLAVGAVLSICFVPLLYELLAPANGVDCAGFRGMNAKATGLALSALVVAAGASSGCGPNDGRRPTFRVLADGRPAVVAETVSLQWPAGQPVGIIGGIAVCGPIAYLTAPVVGTVHRVDLDAGRATGSIGRSGQGPGEFQAPVLPVADCARNLLHVVEAPFRVSTFSIPDGRFVRTRQGDPAFYFFPGGRALLSAGGGHLYAPGIWNLDFGAIPDGEYYRGTRLMAELSLADDTSRPLFTPVTPDCLSGDAECLIYTFDRTGTGEDAGWVYAQGSGTSVGVAAADGTLVRTLGMASPRFLRDGRRLAFGLGPTETTEWGLTNSTLGGVYAFGGHIAVVHRHNATTWDPSGVAAVEFNVFMNVFDAEGRGLIADLSLPDIPIGRGDDLIYVVDYGPAGRGADGIDSIRLLGVSVEESLREYGVDTGRE